MDNVEEAVAPTHTSVVGQAKPLSEHGNQMRRDAAEATITIHPLRDNISALIGGPGGNIAVLTGADGKLLVDSSFVDCRAQITEALDAISPDPLRYVVNTHWHLDHTDGNEWMHSAGATIIAHERTRLRLSTPQDIAAFGVHFDPVPASALPTVVFSTSHTIYCNSTTLLLTRYEPAHSDTDISIYFTDADILHTGDTFCNGAYPFIDYSSGGHIDGMIRAAERNLAIGTDSTILVPGHGPISNKTQLAESHQMFVAIRYKIAALKRQGRSLEETVAAKPTAKFDATFDTGTITGDFFTRLVYQGV
ncbi:MBL fold metallo-hydrolase [Granulicella sp. dw_53]|uniref:MBL fold metallo-hydrolase n=1 Tax=Granulicella sp. dw_53 TaxID=2719792 RepID=UPI001BD564CC|nr:MBL fold metallo-hydrolase [Granulicella sp. dw_53]